MYRGVADIGADGVSSRGVQVGRQARCHPCEGLLPAGGAQAAVNADQRFAQAVRIVVQRAQGDAFRAQVTAAEHVLAIAAYAQHAVPVVLDGEAAGRLAQRTRAVAGYGLCRSGFGHETAPATAMGDFNLRRVGAGAAHSRRGVKCIRRLCHREGI